MKFRWNFVWFKTIIQTLTFDFFIPKLVWFSPEKNSRKGWIKICNHERSYGCRLYCTIAHHYCIARYKCMQEEWSKALRTIKIHGICMWQEQKIQFSWFSKKWLQILIMKPGKMVFIIMYILLRITNILAELWYKYLKTFIIT